ncbi:class IV adenylate cyclase [Halovivax limisalsi]|uniref:class IV adenylate cyclase n=1 Tax=Halovivax limisalsi TaxID=1453760 RepID=UPI001FFC8A9C|nr:class IV adenylate cyclase [Halovivax limisalsi]
MAERDRRSTEDGEGDGAYEVEVKVPADHDRVRDRLAELDATSTGGVVQVDTYFDAPHRSFAETDEALRVRRERAIDAVAAADDPVDEDHPADEIVELTYKGPLVDAGSKTRSEVETVVADGDSVETILESLGFEAAATVRKERERFDVDDVTVSLDTVDGVGRYVEVERRAEEAAIEETRADLYAVLDSLGLDPADQVRTSYLGLKLDGA